MGGKAAAVASAFPRRWGGGGTGAPPAAGAGCMAAMTAAIAPVGPDMLC
eukprot:SAG31_NODE_2619_length_5365_cov_3.812002_1_plen_49_part_00